ncbi:hypothetical protein [Streptomyces sp. KL116D]|uniref:hypothetical protein n=1 Tax=Streptomyces sp. KL116D TaxID=3045152 RepID=UPI0035586AB0
MSAVPTPEAYPGELAMLRGLVRAIRTIAEHSDMDEVRHVLAEHATDERASYDALGEKATAHAAATATPAGPLGAGARNRLALLRSSITERQGEWTTRRVQAVYHAHYGADDWRATARRDLAQLHAEGLLVEHTEDPTRHHYTVNTRTGGHS